MHALLIPCTYENEQQGIWMLTQAFKVFQKLMQGICHSSVYFRICSPWIINIVQLFDDCVSTPYAAQKVLVPGMKSNKSYIDYILADAIGHNWALH